VPAAQLEHDEAPAGENWPAAHMAQPAALMVPPFVTVPAKPGAQTVQADARLLPTEEPAVVMPKGHGMQAHPVKPYCPE
jgi:hypothetical protein